LHNCRIETSQNIYGVDEGWFIRWYDSQMAADLSKPRDAM
jgi:hypothetical protein